MTALGAHARLRRRLSALAGAVLAAAIAALLATSPGAAQGAMRLTADPASLPANGGQSRILVQIPAAAAGGATHAALTTDLGAFTADSGPQRLEAKLTPSSTAGLLRASAVLVGDGRAGVSVVTARVGTQVDTVSVRFIGAPARITQRAPTADHPLDALHTHQISVEVRDANDYAVAGADVQFRIVQAPAEGAELRSGARAQSEQMTVVSSSAGIAAVLLSGSPGVVQIQASSGAAALRIRLELHGEPARLRLIGLDAETIQAGEQGAVGSLQALLVDGSGRSAPNQRISFNTPAGAPAVAADGEGESFFTDSAGRARFHIDAAEAALGEHTITARWSRGGRTLTDSITVVVSGRPASLYLIAKPIASDINDPIGGLLSDASHYRIEAHVVDVRGQLVAGSWEIRWRPRVPDANALTAASASPEVSPTRNGVASATFKLTRGSNGVDLTSVQAEAWLIEAAQVNNRGAIADLLAPGVPLRSGWNFVIWRGESMLVSEALASIRHVTNRVSRWRSEGGWDNWSPAPVPGKIDFRLDPGDRIYIVLDSAARLERIER